jgi:hypothetical protein
VADPWTAVLSPAVLIIAECNAPAQSRRLSTLQFCQLINNQAILLLMRGRIGLFQPASIISDGPFPRSRMIAISTSSALLPVTASR